MTTFCNCCVGKKHPADCFLLCLVPWFLILSVVFRQHHIFLMKAIIVHCSCDVFLKVRLTFEESEQF